MGVVSSSLLCDAHLGDVVGGRLRGGPLFLLPDRDRRPLDEPAGTVHHRDMTETPNVFSEEVTALTLTMLALAHSLDARADLARRTHGNDCELASGLAAGAYDIRVRIQNFQADLMENQE